MKQQDAEYDVVVGLEVHIQLNTNSKLFCSDAALYGAAPNYNTSAITLGHPGTMPRVNQIAIEKAVTLGLVLGCSITTTNYFSRKHYLYPDLPKGFQTTQHIDPICVGGSLAIASANGNKNIAIHHIHLEEDAGKSIHDADPNNTALDYNRAGTPLCELVTEPCINSSEEAYNFLTQLRKLVRWVGISDGNMEEGSLRCDVNVSLKPKGSTVLGTRVEVKNVNSIKFAKKAIEIEVARLAAILNNGEKVHQETRSFDAVNETTFSLRSKEDANDYRYFIEPDLSPTIISQTTIKQLQHALPALPQQIIINLQTQYGLSLYDATSVVDDYETYQYFSEAILTCTNAKGIINFINGPIKQYSKEQNISIKQCPIVAATTANIVNLIDANTITFGTASSKLFAALLKQTNHTPLQLIDSMQLTLQINTDELDNWVTTVLQKNEAKVAEYKKGKKGLIGYFVGEVVKLSKGKAAPKETQEILQTKLMA